MWKIAIIDSKVTWDWRLRNGARYPSIDNGKFIWKKNLMIRFKDDRQSANSTWETGSSEGSYLTGANGITSKWRRKFEWRRR